MRTIAGLFLRWGTLLAGMWILAGSLFFFLSGYAPITGPPFLPELGRGWVADEALFIIRLGTMILLLTPILSTLFIGLHSLRQRDWLLVGAALIIMSILWLNSPFH